MTSDDNEFARYLASYLESNQDSFGAVYDVDVLYQLIKQFQNELP